MSGTLLTGSRSLMLELLNSLRLVPIIINNSWCNIAVFSMWTKRNKPTKLRNSTFGSLYRVDFFLCITPKCLSSCYVDCDKKWTEQNYKTIAILLIVSTHNGWLFLSKQNFLFSPGLLSSCRGITLHRKYHLLSSIWVLQINKVSSYYFQQLKVHIYNNHFTQNHLRSCYYMLNIQRAPLYIDLFFLAIW